ncbi:PKD domain-containing protein [Hymenobacter sp. GOD-10R]|uniref:PKD domain-containing protein n=1 Tax=Hymenobacter sp. GOD-10R TaxID=3093922 RepID=UPI002D781146|nr:PKD domain-containing protein [Hymenobacter sp. GOD-10R]WRQ27233.1 PKD domain-containing protein [Hymenobacter sp. GOD-10R]
MKLRLLLLASATLLASCDDEEIQPDTEFVTAFDLPDNGESQTIIAIQNQSKNGLRYVWNFGDGTTSQEENPTHIFESPGIYAVKLKALGFGKSDSVTKTIKIAPFNLFTRVDSHFAGTYDCKVVYEYSAYQSPTTRTRLPDQEVVITEAGASTLKWNDALLSYYPSITGSPQLPYNSAYNFYSLATSAAPRTTASAKFYAAGDSAVFSISKRTGASNGSATTTYHGIRRP